MTRVLSVVDATPPAAATANANPAVSAWSDWLGMVAAIGCAIHCAAMPFVIAYLPALGLSFLADPAFDRWMAVGCFAIAVSAFVPGYLKHGSFTPMVVGSLGVATISFAAFGFAGDCCPPSETGATQIALADGAACTDAHCEPCCPSESAVASVSAGADSPKDAAATQAGSLYWSGFAVPLLSPLGACVLVAGHLLNRRYGFQCGCCSSEAAKGSIHTALV